MAKPTKLPEWASVPSVDPVVGGANIVEPPEQQKQEGWARKQIPPANYQNWWQNLVYLWIVYHEGKIETSGFQTGDIKATYRSHKYI